MRGMGCSIVEINKRRTVRRVGNSGSINVNTEVRRIPSGPEVSCVSVICYRGSPVADSGEDRHEKDEVEMEKLVIGEMKSTEHRRPCGLGIDVSTQVKVRDKISDTNRT